MPELSEPARIGVVPPNRPGITDDPNQPGSGVGRSELLLALESAPSRRSGTNGIPDLSTDGKPGEGTGDRTNDRAAGAAEDHAEGAPITIAIAA